jgi:hypothetical protein
MQRAVGVKRPRAQRKTARHAIASMFDFSIYTQTTRGSSPASALAVLPQRFASSDVETRCHGNNDRFTHSALEFILLAFDSSQLYSIKCYKTAWSVCENEVRSNFCGGAFVGLFWWRAPRAIGFCFACGGSPAPRHCLNQHCIACVELFSIVNIPR